MAEVQDQDDIGELEAVEQEIAEQEKPKLEDVIPEKYRGRSVEDLVKMHQEAEKTISRQGIEVGEVRKLADELIRSQLKPTQAVEKVEPEVDFFENPQEAIRRAVEQNPKVLAAEQQAAYLRMEMAKRQLIEKHPDFGQVVSDGEFVEWVKASKVRAKLFQEANNYDVDAADELLSTFKTLKAARESKVNEVEKESRSKAMSAAAVDTGGSGDSGKKVYSRRAIIQLQISNPAKFAAMKPEIDRAYEEGRIRP